jgi:hypothetical protein
MFGSIFGDITATSQFVGSEYYLAWAQFWHRYSEYDYHELPNVTAPEHFEDVDHLMKKSVIDKSRGVSSMSKAETVAEGQRLLHLLRKYHAVYAGICRTGLTVL